MSALVLTSPIDGRTVPGIAERRDHGGPLNPE